MAENVEFPSSCVGQSIIVFIFTWFKINVVSRPTNQLTSCGCPALLTRVFTIGSSINFLFLLLKWTTSPSLKIHSSQSTYESTGNSHSSHGHHQIQAPMEIDQQGRSGKEKDKLSTQRKDKKVTANHV
eukprot:2311087-Amphidinium_carterae.2